MCKHFLGKKHCLILILLTLVFTLNHEPLTMNHFVLGLCLFLGKNITKCYELVRK